MNFDILSIGDAEIMAQAFNGVAAIFASGDMDKLAESGSVIALMIICFGYMTEREFPLQHLLIGIIVYSVMFVPKATVNIEDVYTGQVRIVANVPIGVAAPMSIISTMGVKMTEMFEVAFSTPDESKMLKNGYMDSLNTLLKLRNIGMGTAGSDALMNGDMDKTINAYIENCVMLDLELNEGGNGIHEVTREGLEKSTDLWAAMKTSFVNADIMVYLSNNQPDGVQKSCKDAYDMIDVYLKDNTFNDAMNNYVKGVIGKTDAIVPVTTDIDIAKAALELSAIDAQTYMRNALLASYLKDGPSAFIKRTGQEQLNLQWSSEQTMFNQIARPLMAFVELFAVAVSPIVAFMSTLGPMGLAAMASYLQLMLWIALWGPLMAVCNLYIAVVTTRALHVISVNAASNGSGLEAMTMHDQLYLTLETWLSTGGMLAASVPALSLMIVYGGSVAASNISNKMSSGASGSVNTARLAPEAMSLDPAMKLSGGSESSPNTGSNALGMADKNFSVGGMAKRAKSSSASAVHSASVAVAQSQSKMNGTSTRSGEMKSAQDSLINSINESLGAGTTTTDSQGITTTKGGRMSVGEEKATRDSVDAVMGLGSTGIPFIKAAVGSNAQASAGSSVDRSLEMGKAASAGWQKNDMTSRMKEWTASSSNQNSNQRYTGSETSSENAEQYRKDLQASEQAQKDYAETASVENSASMSTSPDYHQLGALLNQSGAQYKIDEANNKLKNKIGSKDYEFAKGNAKRDIENSSAKGQVGGNRSALEGFLILNSEDPVAAAKIFNDHVMPALHDSKVLMAPTQNSDLENSPEDIVSKKQAAEFELKATGNKEIVPDNVDGGIATGKQTPLPGTKDQKHALGKQRAKTPEGKGQGRKPESNLPKKNPGSVSWANEPQESGRENGGTPSAFSGVRMPTEREAGKFARENNVNAERSGTELMNEAVKGFVNGGTDVVTDGAKADIDFVKDRASEISAGAVVAAQKANQSLGSVQKNIENGAVQLFGADKPNEEKSDNEIPDIKQ